MELDTLQGKELHEARDLLRSRVLFQKTKSRADGEMPLRRYNAKFSKPEFSFIWTFELFQG